MFDCVPSHPQLHARCAQVEQRGHRGAAEHTLRLRQAAVLIWVVRRDTRNRTVSDQTRKQQIGRFGIYIFVVILFNYLIIIFTIRIFILNKK